MQPDENPFADIDDMGPGSSPFGAADHVVCCKCGGSVPREDAAFKIKTGPSWGGILLWGPIWGLILGDEQKKRGFYCPLCLRLYLQEERRKKMLVSVAIVAIVGLVLLLVLLELLK